MFGCREKVQIPWDKPYILLEGEGSKYTVIEWNDCENIDKPAFGAYADNFVAKYIGFLNTCNKGHTLETRKRAVAAQIAGDKSAFYECSFYGLQDTLYDKFGRHYFKSCYIEGAVDFIFGHGQSIYESCNINVTAGTSLQPGVAGFITANGRDSKKENTGFVFKHCSVFGTGTTYLGRAWGSYSRVLFYQSDLSNVVVPQGWDAWLFVNHEETITYAEYDCRGSGSNTVGRVPWETKMDLQTVNYFADMSYIDPEGWLKKQP
ncbi:Pectinesterase qrt1 [Thalictrum thalictroides]|uniref:Pectinesterase n=1 Tax=Thalictrum thalictroides TaxID=46969 RepID=A0A7J6V3I3_THATH|nr:Pectinesterase qrt1 [Thalictrum thalictroides]